MPDAPPLDPVTGFVISLYVRILSRGPDQAGLQAFVTQLQQTQSILPTVKCFLASPEFLGCTTSNTEFATLLYRVCLGRVPDAGGLAFYVNRLTQGTATRDQLVTQFAASPEFRAIERATSPPSSIAGVYTVTGSASFTNCQPPANNGTAALTGTMEWRQAGATIQATFSIPFPSLVRNPAVLTGIITGNGQFTGDFSVAYAASTGGDSFIGPFTGSVASSMFSLQFSGQLQAEACHVSGSLSGTRS